MCGLAGILSGANTPATDIGAIVSAMNDVLAHRGPDAEGTWVDREAGLAFGHRRLSIVDVSPAGAQPMHASNGRWVTVYNGELYNTEDIRAELVHAGHVVNWRGHSDTEVILEAVSVWGVQAAVEKFNGIFAIAFWDRRERELWLVRDRIGVKPLYWTRLMDGTILFGSELRALLRHPNCPAEIEPRAVAALLRSACIPAPLTIYRGVHKLLPAHLLSVKAGAEPALSCYWNLQDIAAAGQRDLAGQSEPELVDELERLLRDAVGRQLVSDVPLGAFLSGGIDSSTVVALMQSQSAQPVRTFSIGFRDKKFNEADHARRVAEHLGTRHTELVVEPEAARAVIQRLPEIYDEPFADSSQIPTFLVSELARRHVTVALSGDGGDECFAGYTRYHWIDRLARWTGVLPKPLLRGAGSALQCLSTETWDALLSPIPQRLRPALVGDKIHKGAGLLALDDADGMYRAVTAQWPRPESMVPGFAEIPTEPNDQRLAAEIPNTTSRLRYRDMMQYLPDDILTKVDRASMAVGLEVRVPLLDQRVIEYSWRLPQSALSRGLTGKRILRRVLARHVPAELFDRQKMGFGIPIGDWIRGPLAGWASDLLSERALRATGQLNVELVRQRFEEHQQGRRNWQHGLWTILMFQAWHQRWAS
jgi:asparagine synthase (glutamine-hydrolysing)